MSFASPHITLNDLNSGPAILTSQLLVFITEFFSLIHGGFLHVQNIISTDTF
jgi:hypothetical protein